MANFIPSEYQKAVFNFIKNGKGNLVINAVAGSGKTKTLEEACKIISPDMRKQDLLFMAFNKSISQELEGRVGQYAMVKNLHQFGYSCIAKHVRRGQRINMDKVKYKKILDEIVDQNLDNRAAVIDNALTLLNLCRVNLIKHNDTYGINAIIKHHGLDIVGCEVRIVNDLLAEVYKLDMSQDVTIDFTDMITIPVTMNWIPYFSLVFVDECQDLNTTEREMMRIAASRGGRFVAVGDPHQAINGFAGADCDSFAKIQALPNTTTLPLSVNYRCGRAMIDLAKAIVPEITAHDNAIDGEVKHVDELTLDLFRENDMVLCRCTAPLIAMALKLIRAGKTAKVLGRDIAENLRKMVEKSKAKTIKGFQSWVEIEKAKLAKEIAKKENITLSEAEETGRFVAFMDRVNCILVFGEEETKLDVVLAKLNNIFAADKLANAVTLCTCHKSKGLESDRVIILLPNKLPLVWKGQLDWEYEQECNLKYVAVTRAKKELVFVDVELSSLLKTEFYQEQPKQQ